jgi:hypothetical protein
MNRIFVVLATLFTLVMSGAALAQDLSYVPYTGMGDPEGLISSDIDIDMTVTGSIASAEDYVPYTGIGDPDGLTAAA